MKGGKNQFIKDLYDFNAVPDQLVHLQDSYNPNKNAYRVEQSAKKYNDAYAERDDETAAIDFTEKQLMKDYKGMKFIDAYQYAEKQEILENVAKEKNLAIFKVQQQGPAPVYEQSYASNIIGTQDIKAWQERLKRDELKNFHNQQELLSHSLMKKNLVNSHKHHGIGKSLEHHLEHGKLTKYDDFEKSQALRAVGIEPAFYDTSDEMNMRIMSDIAKKYKKDGIQAFTPKDQEKNIRDFRYDNYLREFRESYPVPETYAPYN